jgi:hypothetical protein
VLLSDSSRTEKSSRQSVHGHRAEGTQHEDTFCSSAPVGKGLGCFLLELLCAISMVIAFKE